MTHPEEQANLLDDEANTELSESCQGIGKRIAQISDLVGTRAESASVMRVSLGSLQRYIRGENMPPFDVAARLCIYTGASMEWLATGDGAAVSEVASHEDGSISSKIRPDIFRLAVEFVDREAPRFGDRATSEARAEAYLLVYDMLMEDARPNEKQEPSSNAELITKATMAGLMRRG